MTTEKLQQYQVVVELESGRELRVGPVLTDKAIVEVCVGAINKNVAEGRERTWRNARCATVEHTEH